jgi:hypothetical protein
MRTRQEDSVRNARISTRTATRLAWSLWVVCVALIALALFLQFATHDIIINWPQERLGPGLAVLTGVVSLTFPTVGALIISRLPTNPVGWIFCGVGLLYAVRRFTEAYADYALTANFTFSGGEYVAWFSSWVGFAGPILAGVILMLLFPNGRLPSRRWRIVAWTAVCGAALTVLADAFTPGPLSTHTYVINPFGLAAGIGGGFTTYELFPMSAVLGTTLLLLSSTAALVALIMRLYRAQGDERQQLKWFLFAAVPATVCLNLVLSYSIIATYTTNFLFNTVWILPWDVFNYILYIAVFALLVVPVCTYIAILRYRLYDIDVVINRALVYGALTATLAAVYFGGVTATQTIFRSLTGQEQQPQLSIVVSTLVIAALFSPLRRRIQAFIDRRFYRKKYDAAKTLAAFSAKLRDETDLDALNAELVGVVRETMQPTHVSLWLRPNPAPTGDEGSGEPRG